MVLCQAILTVRRSGVPSDDSLKHKEITVTKKKMNSLELFVSCCLITFPIFFYNHVIENVLNEKKRLNFKTREKMNTDLKQTKHDVKSQRMSTV